MVSKAWKELSDEERERWEAIARKDKARYEMEKAMYKGPWKVAAKGKFPKDHEAPKKPMSAYLSFSNCKRAAVKAQYPTADSTEISRILAQLWRDATEDERKEHVEKEYILRQEYKTEMAEWSRRKELEYQTARKEREDRAMRGGGGPGHESSVSHASRYEYAFRGQWPVGTHLESDDLQIHPAIPQGHYQVSYGAQYGSLPHFYPSAHSYYYPDHYLYHDAEYNGEYPLYNSVYADCETSYSVPSAAPPASAAHETASAGAAWDPLPPYFNHHDQTMHPAHATSYPFYGHDHQEALEESQGMYHQHPYSAPSSYHSGPHLEPENQKQHFQEAEPSPLSASCDLFALTFHGDHTDDSPHDATPDDANQQENAR